jgi:GntR family transcriptional regulator, transcriptional repressor for pyruvate dehydrogenase complex
VRGVTVNKRSDTAYRHSARLAGYPVEERVGESVVEQLRPVARPRLYEVIVEQLCAYIADNEMDPGDRLPAERDLAAKLGVSRASLSQALVALEVQGVLSVRHGDGAILIRRPAEDRAIKALREHADRIPDIIEAREALEVKLVGLAAARRSDAEMAAIDAAIEKMEAEVDAGERGVVGDEMFHEAITAAAHSSLLAKLMHEISGLIKETRIESLSQEDRPRASLEGHRRIADAVRKQDPQEASQAMADHIRLVSDVALLRDAD